MTTIVTRTVKGSALTWAEGDANFNNLNNDKVEGVDGVAALRLLSPSTGLNVHLNYHTTAGDGGHGPFRALTGAAPGTYTDDNGITIVPTGGDGSSCWRRVINGNYATPEMYGAGNSADDYTAIQSAVNYLQTIGGGKVNLEDTTYSISDKILVTSDNIELIGRSRASRIVRTTAGPAIHFQGSSASYSEYLNGCGLSDLTVEASANTAGNNGVFLEYVWNFTADTCYFKTVNSCFYQKGVIRSVFNNIFNYDYDISTSSLPNYIFYADASVDSVRDADNTYNKIIAEALISHFHLAGTATYPQDGVNITGCILFFAGAATNNRNIYIAYGLYIDISDNALFESGGNSIELVAPQYYNVSNNNIARPGKKVLGHGVYVDGVSASVSFGGNITDNNINHSSGHGVYVKNTDRFAISGNEIYKPSSNSYLVSNPLYANDGIYVDGCNYGKISSNAVMRSKYSGTETTSHRYDINIQGTCRGVDVYHERDFAVNIGTARHVDKPNHFSGASQETVDQIMVLGEAFDNAAWTKSNNGGAASPTVSADATVAPDGTTTADDVTFGAVAGTTPDSELQINIINAVTSSDIWYPSIFLKAATPCALMLDAYSAEDGTEGTLVCYVDTTWRRFYLPVTGMTAGLSITYRLRNMGGNGIVTVSVWGANLYKATKLLPYCKTSSNSNRSIPVGTVISNGLRTIPGTAAPTTLGYSLGDVVVNTAPSAGSPAGWVCVTAGVPGTWSPYGHSVIENSKAYDPPSVAAGATTTTTITVTGAALGDYAEASFSLALGGLVLLNPEVSAANTVTVTLWNPTGVAIDLASGTLKARVRK